MTPPIRRPRFERAKVAGIKLTPRDLEILRAVHRHRLLRSTHLIALLDGSPQTTLRRLQLLFHHGYLDRPAAQLDWYAQGSEPMVYALGNRGGAVLAAKGARGRAPRVGHRGPPCPPRKGGGGRRPARGQDPHRPPPVPPPHPRRGRGHGGLRG